MKIYPLSLKYWKYDLSAGIVVFLVAIPLCVGISLASGVGPIAGLLAGIIGGALLVFFTDTPYAVRGPAAALIGIVLSGIEKLGTFEAFLTATIIAGAFQIALGLFRAGVLAYFIPSSVIKGMLAFIGISLIVKQIPHALGYDIDKFEWHFNVEGHKNIFYVVYESFEFIEPGALLIALSGFLLMIFWQKKMAVKFPYLPASLMVVVLGVLMNEMYQVLYSDWYLGKTHLVAVPQMEKLADYFTLPDRKAFLRLNTWFVGIFLGVIASIETLLTLEAMDKLDPKRRKSAMNEELFASGIGNIVAGSIGALPLNVVIVRSSTALTAGGKTKLTNFIHGILLAIFVFAFPSFLNKIPLASLAVILIVVGIKLAAPKIFIVEWKLGIYRFVPFVVTLLASLFSDLLNGILIGMAVGGIFILYEHYRMAVQVHKQGDTMRIFLSGNISFLVKPILIKTLQNIPEDVKNIIIETRELHFIDFDIMEILYEFKERAQAEGKNLQCVGIDLSVFEESGNDLAGKIGKLLKSLRKNKQPI